MPRRVASIDLGTNAIRFYAVEMEGDTVSRVLAEARFPVRFGHGVFSAGRISPEDSAAALDGLEGVSTQMKDLGIQKYRAVATSAIRESPNRREFARAVKRRTGISLEIISGSEEIRLVHLAVTRRILLGADQWIMVELGGGSVEVALATSARILWCEAHAMGAVRLLELFAPDGKETSGLPGASLRVCRNHPPVAESPRRLSARVHRDGREYRGPCPAGLTLRGRI